MSDLENANNENASKSNKSSRRSFIKKAAVGAPVISTIASKPVWAGQCSLSGNMSGNTSQHDRTDCLNFQGYSPGGWKENGNGNGNASQNGGAYQYWPLLSCKKEHSLSSYFNISSDFQMQIPSGHQSNAIKESGLMTNCLYNALLSNNGVIKQFTAALLNADLSEQTSYLDYPYTVQDIKDIFNKADHSSEEFLEFLVLLQNSQNID